MTVEQDPAAVLDLPEWAKRLVVFDTETTGLNLSTARLVTACIAELDENGNLVGQALEWLINPGVEIPEAAASVHGISTARAQAEGVDPARAISEIVETLNGYLSAGVAVVAYNAPYDFTILRNDAERNGVTPLMNPNPVLDPLVIDKALDKWRKGSRVLGATAAHYGVVLENAHNATSDALAAGNIMQAIARRFNKELAGPLAELHGKQIAWSNEQTLSFADWKHRNGEPTFEAKLGWPEKS